LHRGEGGVGVKVAIDGPIEAITRQQQEFYIQTEDPLTPIDEEIDIDGVERNKLNVIWV